MILEWIRFGLAACFLMASVFFFLTAALGVNKRSFDFVLNRMHAAGIGDTMGLLCALLGVAAASGWGWHLTKLLFVAVFMWLTAPVSSHLLAETELFTSSHPVREGSADSPDGAG